MEYDDKILSYIMKNVDITQRGVAKHFDISLGYTNARLQSLVEEGSLNIEQISHRNFRYTLTSLGVKRVVKERYEYILNAIRTISLLEQELGEIIECYGSKGYMIYLDEIKDEIYPVIKQLIKDRSLSKIKWLSNIDKLNKTCEKMLVLSWGNEGGNKEICKALGIEYINLLTR